MKHILNLVIFSAFTFIFLGFSACKNKETPAPACVAGTGGNNTVVAYLYHHDSLIANKPDYRDTVYVKFNTLNFPGTGPSSYDAVFVGDSAENHIRIDGLICGDYYLFGVALDTISSPGFPFRVFGGIPFSITGTGGSYSIHIPVVE